MYLDLLYIGLPEVVNANVRDCILIKTSIKAYVYIALFYTR